MNLAVRLAVIAADSFHAACGEPDRWLSLSQERRALFLQLGEIAVETARSHREVVGVALEPFLARALSDAYLAGDCPRWLRVKYDWTTGYRRAEARPIFLQVARAMIDEGRRQKAARTAVAA